MVIPLRGALFRWLWIQLVRRKSELLIVSLAVLVRVVLWVVQPGGLYYPDSWWYISALTSHTVGSFHPPAISAIWFIGTFGQTTASSVLVLQAVLGVFACVLLYDLLTIIVKKRIALILAAVWAVFPSQLIYERTFLVEAVCNVLIIFSLWSFARMLTGVKPVIRYVLFLCGISSLSLIAVSVPALDLAVGAITVALSLVYWLTFVHKSGVPSHLRWKNLGLGWGAFIIFIAPIIALGALYKHDFGEFSVDPASGSYLYARWSPLVPCTQNGSLTTETKQVLAEFCGQHFTSVPGDNSDNLWSTTSPALNNSLAYSPIFVETQHQLTSLVEHAIESHPFQFLAQVGDSIYYQVAISGQSGSIAQLTNGASISAITADTPAWVRWFGASPKVVAGAPTSRLISLAYKTARWTQYMLWLVLFASLLTLTWNIIRRRNMRRKEFVRVLLLRLKVSKVPARVTIGISAAVLVVFQILEVALSGVPDTRYLVTLTPELLVMMALLLPISSNDLPDF